MTPAELMKAILQAPVDLLWNGGIGTYVKASTRPTPTPATRPTTRSGSTAATCAPSASARAATSGSPSSAGSSTPSTAAGSTPTSSTTRPASTPPTTRSTSRSCSTGWSPTATSPRSSATTCSPAMTDEVADLVLRDNYEQNLALANAAANAPSLLHVHEDWMKKLERRRRAQPRARGAADRPPGTPAARPRRGPDRARAVGAAGLDQDRAGRRAARLRPARRPLPRPRPDGVLPEADAGGLPAADRASTRCAARSS